ncbi:hypothetical protein [Nocardiopsis composta]|uniref:Uncharacterized protein n=1 Tax=Nocardiopsis composta TaxID=157465 RepID=A0A7W8QNS7_9ACTN|nr:hypothetical protein [Nocardiopsis composta]MBB5433877.1 hypothetical protein [Nocardiopsis composta]
MAAWVLPAAWGRVLLVLPPAWLLLVFPGHPGEGDALPVLLGGAVVTIAAGALAAHRVHASWHRWDAEVGKEEQTRTAGSSSGRRFPL